MKAAILSLLLFSAVVGGLKYKSNDEVTQKCKDHFKNQVSEEDLDTMTGEYYYDTCSFDCEWRWGWAIVREEDGTKCGEEGEACFRGECATKDEWNDIHRCREETKDDKARPIIPLYLKEGQHAECVIHCFNGIESYKYIFRPEGTPCDDWWDDISNGECNGQGTCVEKTK